MDWEGRLPLSSNRTGPFVSALTQVVLQLGQRPIALQSSQYEGDEAAANGKRKSEFGDAEDTKRMRPGSGSNSKKGKAKGGKPRASVTLKELVDFGVILPGRNKISVQYKGINYLANLGKDGVIMYQGKKFGSATAFSIYCKRMQTPNKQGDDGWKSTLYDGQPLENYRRKYFQESGLDGEAEQHEEGPDDTQQAAAPQQSVPQQQAQPQQQQEPAETDHWVQCDRCRTWRIVPDASWPSVEADTRESWFCEWATWDVRLQVPHNPPCMQKA
ncbi:hypothetical protein ABBQ32_006240 [Trebouxia sp. C0010 RCD-2024]